MVPDRRVVSISLLLAAGVLMIYVFLLVTKTSVAQTADCEASRTNVDTIDESPDDDDDTIDEPPDPGDDTIDGDDVVPSKNCDDEGGTGNGSDTGDDNVEILQESEQESESGDIDQSFEVS